MIHLAPLCGLLLLAAGAGLAQEAPVLPPLLPIEDAAPPPPPVGTAPAPAAGVDPALVRQLETLRADYAALRARHAAAQGTAPERPETRQAIAEATVGADRAASSLAIARWRAETAEYFLAEIAQSGNQSPPPLDGLRHEIALVTTRGPVLAYREPSASPESQPASVGANTPLLMLGEIVGTGWALVWISSIRGFAFVFRDSIDSVEVAE